ncbi:hypothetical protein F4801DRAFT_600549 [Xylaria longipes]|nr:hypothetical protein F4801DRAFT_600549 [Xylaria longipes]
MAVHHFFHSSHLFTFPLTLLPHLQATVDNSNLLTYNEFCGYTTLSHEELYEHFNKEHLRSVQQSGPPYQCFWPGNPGIPIPDGPPIPLENRCEQTFQHLGSADRHAREHPSRHLALNFSVRRSRCMQDGTWVTPRELPSRFSYIIDYEQVGGQKEQEVLIGYPVYQNVVLEPSPLTDERKAACCSFNYSKSPRPLIPILNHCTVECTD